MDKNKIKLQDLVGTIPVTISDTVLNQIKYLTSKIHNVEWSGVLFYSTISNINKPSEFSINLEYIYLMDKGSGAATQYELNEELIEFRMSNPTSLSWKIGHIHSHHNMKAYFSGVDDDEILENSEFHNYYLSIIVNNNLDIVGKIAFRGSTNDKVTYNCKSDNGDSYKLRIVEKKDIVFVYKCELPKLLFNIDSNFNTRLEYITKKNNVTTEKIAEARRNAYTQSKTPYSRNGYHKMNTQKQLVEKVKRNDFSLAEQFSDDTEDDFMDLMDEFPTYWLGFGQLGSENDTPEDAIEKVRAYLTNNKISIGKYSDELLNESGNLFNNYFAGMEEATMSDAYRTVLEVLDEYRAIYPFLDILLNNLEMYVDELVEKDAQLELNFRNNDI